VLIVRLLFDREGMAPHVSFSSPSPRFLLCHLGHPFFPFLNVVFLNSPQWVCLSSCPHNFKKTPSGLSRAASLSFYPRSTLRFYYTSVLVRLLFYFGRSCVERPPLLIVSFNFPTLPIVSRIFALPTRSGLSFLTPFSPTFSRIMLLSYCVAFRCRGRIVTPPIRISFSPFPHAFPPGRNRVVGLVPLFACPSLFPVLPRSPGPLY